MKSGKSMSIHDITCYTLFCCFKKHFFFKGAGPRRMDIFLVYTLRKGYTYEILLLDGPGASVLYPILCFKLAVIDNS